MSILKYSGKMTSMYLNLRYLTAAIFQFTYVKNHELWQGRPHVHTRHIIWLRVYNISNGIQIYKHSDYHNIKITSIYLIATRQTQFQYTTNVKHVI